MMSVWPARPQLRNLDAEYAASLAGQHARLKLTPVLLNPHTPDSREYHSWRDAWIAEDRVIRTAGWLSCVRCHVLIRPSGDYKCGSCGRKV